MVAEAVGVELVNRLHYFTQVPERVLALSFDGLNESELLQKEYPKANIICEEVVKWPDGKQSAVDVIFANFFLPWQTDLKAQLKALRRTLTPQGLFTFSYLGLDTLKECKAYFAEAHQPDCMDMHDLGDLLLQLGFRDPVLDVSYFSVNYTSKTTLIADLLASYMWFPDEPEKYTSLLPASMELTYEIIYAHAFAPASLSDEDEPGISKVPISAIRKAGPFP